MFGTIVWATVGILVGLFVFRVGLGMLRALVDADPATAAGRRDAQGEDPVPVLALRHRGAHDAGHRRAA